MTTDAPALTAFLAGDRTLADLLVTGYDLREGLSRPYLAQIDLITPEPADAAAIDLDQVLTQEYALVTALGNQEWNLHGVVTSAEHVGQSKDERQRYRIELAPHWWLSTLNRRTRVWRDTTVIDVIKTVLSEAQVDFEAKMSASYPTVDHVTQYEESDFNFISRLLEHEGIAYWFQHAQSSHRLILGDSTNAFSPASDNLLVQFEFGEGGHAGDEVGAMVAFSRTHRVTTKEVVVRDYDPQHPSTPLLGRSSIRTPRSTSVDGVHEGADQQHLRVAEDADRYAAVRSDVLTCQRQLHHGRGNIPGLRAGSPFKIDGLEVHRGDFLCVSTHHVFQAPIAGKAQSFATTCTALKRAQLPWRPPQTTPVPNISGLVSGRILATAGDKDGNHLDGAYRVQVLCESTSTERIVRMAQPYAGPAQGFHFPLPPDTEVLLAHVNGHPDRPIIAAAMPNVENPSPVQEANKTQCVVRSASGSSLVFEDEGGSESITLTSVKGNMLCLSDKDELVTLTATKDHKISVQGKSDMGVVGKTTLSCDDEITFSAANKITLAVGSSVITLTPAGITIEATEVTITASGALKMGAASVDVNADGAMTAHAANLTLAADAAATLNGTQVTLAGTATLSASAAVVTVTADAAATFAGNAVCNVEGALINIKGGATVALSGAMITNN